MTTDEIIAYYTNLLIIQYNAKPKAAATIAAMAVMFIMDQLPTQVMNAYDISSAVGVQLDVLGKYVGVSRNVSAFSGPITLDDADFRTIINLKIVQNNAGSSLSDIQNLLQMNFAGILFVYDHQNMHMDYAFNATYGSQQLAEVFITEGLLPKPMGVQLGALIYIDDLTNIFGMCTYQTPNLPNISGFNDYNDYQTNRPWLTYQDAIFP